MVREAFNKMNRFLLSALQTIVRALIGSLNYERIKTIVLSVESQALSGDEKKQIVLNETANVIEVCGKALVNLAIETAVTAMRNQK